MNTDTTQKSNTLNYQFALNFNPEWFRVVAYASFMIMFVVGALLTTYFVNVEPTSTAIYHLYGFNHACNLIDHEPSRTVSAMIFPFWEIPFVLYVIFNFLRIQDAYRENKAPRYVFLIAAVFFPVELILTVWVRIIFVWSPEVSFLNHYLPYIGLQLLLFLTAFENVLYFRAVKALPFGSPSLANGYLVALFVLTFLCILFGIAIALGNPILDSANNPVHQVILRSLSGLYFIMAIPVPFTFSLMELKKSPKHQLTFA